MYGYVMALAGLLFALSGLAAGLLGPARDDNDVVGGIMIVVSGLFVV
jgi:hypothetical protein